MLVSTKAARTLDRAVHMALGGEVDHCIHPVVAEQAPHQVAVANITLDKHMPGIASQRV